MLRRNRFSIHFLEGKKGGRIGVRERRRRRSRKLLNDLKERSGYWKLKHEALNRALWRIRFERGYVPVVRDYVITMMMMMVMMMMVMMMMMMMVTRPYARTEISKQCLVREIISVSQLRNMYVIIIFYSLLGYAEGRPGEGNIVIVGLD
jgi:hypothetical protein